MSKDLDFSEDVKIDKHELDRELINQPSLYREYAKAYAHSLKVRDKARARIDLVKAEVDSDIRTNYEKFGFDKKPTEAAITQAIIKSEEYNEVYDDFIEKNTEAKIIGHSVEAFVQRKDMLIYLTKLFLSGYYSESTSIHEDIVEKKLKSKQDKKIKKKLASRKKIKKTN